ncbi:proline racemase family protein [Nitratireductor sp. GCM10026969]|uniref:proline racemase family protein n=1 Tax=Nitratireductor sp. GCM10026969 TaxID=3252645 RepID=UPI0036175887
MDESAGRHILDVIDAHAGGDVGRVVLGGVGNLPEGSVADRARFLRHHADRLRRLLINTPYGNPSQCINLVIPPSDPEANAGLIIMGTMGYPDFSGSNAMCTIAALAETGRLTFEDEERTFALETPGGITRLNVNRRSGELVSVAYDALPGFVAVEENLADVEGWGSVRYSLVYGGVFYAVVSGADVGLDPVGTPVPELTRFFNSFLPVAARQELHHPVHGAMPPLKLALLAGTVDRGASEEPSAHVAVYMDPGVICQGPTGTGTTALLAWLERRGEIAFGSTIRTISPFGNEFTGTLTEAVTVGGYAGVGSCISGKPRLLAHSRVIVHSDDPLIQGGELAEILVREDSDLGTTG